MTRVLLLLALALGACLAVLARPDPPKRCEKAAGVCACYDMVDQYAPASGEGQSAYGLALNHERCMIELAPMRGMKPQKKESK